MQRFKGRVTRDWLAFIKEFHPPGQRKSGRIIIGNELSDERIEATRRYVHENPFLDDEVFQEMRWTKTVWTKTGSKNFGQTDISELLIKARKFNRLMYTVSDIW